MHDLSAGIVGFTLKEGQIRTQTAKVEVRDGMGDEKNLTGRLCRSGAALRSP